ncbi:MAG: hypothetical protein PWQ96_1677, partial [Clostridia bacterium]|nr:hypothetical protein [Clostridia bacterium]
AKEKEFTIQRTSKGVDLVPIIDGEPADQQKLNSLPEEEAEEIQNKLPEVQKEFDKVLRKIRNLEKQTFEEMEALEKEFVLSVVEPEIEKLKCKYETNNKIKDYLDSVKEDIIDNLHILKKTEEDNNPLNSFLPVDKHEEFFKRYKVNLFVNNSNTKGAPVIIESNPTYYNLFGKIEGKPQFATITMDFTDIKSGAIHQANGGFLIVYALDILKEPFAWDALKRTLQNEESNIENIGEQFKLYPTETIKPEPIPIKLKVILIGSTQFNSYYIIMMKISANYLK